jgi:hypothetical protein
MKIYIGKDFNGKPISVLLADNIEKAHIAWAGMKDTPHSVEEIDPNNKDIGIYGVVFLLSSVKRNSKNFSSRDGIDFREWKRGV